MSALPVWAARWSGYAFRFEARVAVALVCVQLYGVLLCARVRAVAFPAAGSAAPGFGVALYFLALPYASVPAVAFPVARSVVPCFGFAPAG